MSSIRIPHFDLPFRYGSGGIVAVVEQDSDKDVENCVTAIASTIKGQRIEDPTFGITQPTFQKQPINTGTMTEEVLAQEPRATALIEQSPNILDPLVDDVTVSVSRKEQIS